MTTTHNIIGLLSQTGEIGNICRKVTGNAPLTADLCQEVTLALLEPSKADIIDKVNEQGKLLGYIYRMAYNQWFSQTSPFYTKFKKYLRFKKEYKNEE